MSDKDKEREEHSFETDGKGQWYWIPTDKKKSFKRWLKAIKNNDIYEEDFSDCIYDMKKSKFRG